MKNYYKNNRKNQPQNQRAKKQNHNKQRKSK